MPTKDRLRAKTIARSSGRSGLRLRRKTRALWRLGALVTLLLLAGCRSMGGIRSASGSGRRPSHVESTSPQVRYTDVTEKAGIHFVATNSRTQRKYMVETMGSGCAFIDYDR